MIENIEIEKCTGCGICDLVCPADVIHMEPAPVATEIEGLRQVKLLPVIKVREHCITLLQLRDFLSGADRRRASFGQEPAAAMVKQ